MNKTQIVLEIVTLLQGTPIDTFARQNLFAAGDKVLVEMTPYDLTKGRITYRFK